MVPKFIIPRSNYSCPWITPSTELQRGRQSSQGHRSFNARDNYRGAVTSSAGSSRSRKDTTVTVIASSIVRGVAPLVHGKGFAASGFVYPGHTARQGLALLTLSYDNILVN